MSRKKEKRRQKWSRVADLLVTKWIRVYGVSAYASGHLVNDIHVALERAYKYGRREAPRG